MKFNTQLAERLFSKLGFSLAYVDYRTGDLRFTKPCAIHSGLFEILGICLAGRDLDVVSADVGISCIRGRHSSRGLGERFCITAVAANRERGQTVLRSREDSERWLRQLFDIFPEQMEQARQKFVPIVEQRTFSVRNVCEQYLEAIGFPCSVFDAQERLSTQIAPSHVLQAYEILGHRIGWGAQPIYHFVGVLAVCCLSPKLEPDVAFDFENPAFDLPFMWRVNIVADHLMAYPRPRTIVFSGDNEMGYSTREPMCSGQIQEDPTSA